MQQHGGLIRLGKREHFICDRALQLHVLDKLGGRSYAPPVVEHSVALSASGVAPAAGVGGHAITNLEVLERIIPP